MRRQGGCVCPRQSQQGAIQNRHKRLPVSVRLWAQGRHGALASGRQAQGQGHIKALGDEGYQAQEPGSPVRRRPRVHGQTSLEASKDAVGWQLSQVRCVRSGEAQGGLLAHKQGGEVSAFESRPRTFVGPGTTFVPAGFNFCTKVGGC